MPELYDQLIQAIRTELPDAKLKFDKSKAGRSVIVKVDGKTLGYVNGHRQFRIDSPKLDRKVLIVHPAQIEVAIEFLQSYRREAATV